MTKRPFALTIVNAALAALVVNWLAAWLPSLSTAIKVPAESTIVLAAVGALQERGDYGPNILSLFFLRTRVTVVLALVAALTFFWPVMWIRCEDAGRLVIRRVFPSDAEFQCTAGGVHAAGAFGWRPTVSLTESASAQTAERVLVPHDRNEVVFPGGLAAPTSLLLALNGAESTIAVPSRLPSSHRGCVGAQAYCVQLQAKGRSIDVPLSPQGLFIGPGVAAATARVQAGMPGKQVDPIVVDDLELQPFETVVVDLKKRDDTDNNRVFKSCGKAQFKLGREPSNVWLLDPDAYCR